MSETDGTIREILTKILDRAEDSVREMKESERRIMAAVDRNRNETRTDLKALEDRLRMVEGDLIRNDEKVRGIAGKISGFVAAIMTAAGLILNHLFTR